MANWEKCLIYGSYGYTGELIVELLTTDGHRPTISGRSADKLEEQASRTGLPSIVIDLANQAELENALRKFDVVIHCAGPFAHTFRAMADACISTGTHYLDITGEAEVFAGLADLDNRAREAGTMLLPGAGFDVVPSDCLAAHLKQQLPDAASLELAFHGIGGGVSHGTATTIIENLSSGGAARIDGQLTTVPMFWKRRSIEYQPGKARASATIPWGDVVTAWHSTGIPNICVYVPVPSPVAIGARLFAWLMPLLGTGPVQSFLKSRIDAAPAGPSKEEREKAFTLLWGEATDAKGQTVQARLRVPEGYTLTAATSVLIAAKVLDGDHPAGFQTPSTAYGKDLILEIAGVERTDG